MKILPDGRYELCLPFKSEAINLSSNKDLTWKRHKKMCERAQRNGILDDYKVVFKEREELEIIEKIEEKGTQLLLCIIREEYWITGGRRTVRKIWNACVKCRRFKSKSPMTDPVSLPSERVKDATVFEEVGVDLAGPLYVKRGDKPARFLFKIPTADSKDLEVRVSNHFRKRLRFRAKVIEELKRRFRNEYLGQLIQRQKQHPQSPSIQVGDTVLIRDDWKKRLQWPLARVIKWIPGKNRLVSGNDVTNPPHQKVQQADSSVNCPNPDTLKATEQPQVTRCGRPVKKPDKLNLLTVTDVFD
ncbi:integrase catalytic domain-containing protein [Trichonephila clavipes]|nr:integrase catalytic domain-containing protein [Trichonephila clavipes]